MIDEKRKKPSNYLGTTGAFFFQKSQYVIFFSIHGVRHITVGSSYEPVRIIRIRVLVFCYICISDHRPLSELHTYHRQVQHEMNSSQGQQRAIKRRA